MAATTRTLDVIIQPQIPVFKGESYEFWSIKMKTLLKSYGLWDFVEAEINQENERQDAQALFFIQQAVDESIFSKIAVATSAKQAWLLLKSEYGGEGQTEETANIDVALEDAAANIDVALEDAAANIDVALEDAASHPGDVAISIQRLIKYAEKTKDCQSHIYMAHSILRDHNPSAFKPRLVSIGPLHRNDKNLQSNERQKAAHMWSLFTNIKEDNLEVTFQKCLDKVRAKIDEIKSCYSGTLSYSDPELAEMMVLDGCYILEFLYKFFKGEKSKWGSPLVVESTFYDFILLENQIPYIVLELIFECTISRFEKHSVTLITLIRPVLQRVGLFKSHKHNISPSTTPHHILDLLHNCYLYRNAKSSESLNSRIPSAVELDRAGMNFKPIRATEWPMEMEVKTYRLPCCSCSWGKPTLIMPLLDIDDFTELVFRNLIAYEQSSQNVPRYVSSYAVAIDMLIDTEEDVATLVKSNVIVNHIGSNQEAADMINNICKEVTWSEFFYNEQYQVLNRHYHGYWSKNIAWLRRTYFNNPWNIIALFAGIFLFVLTVVQTIFTVNPTK